MNPIKQSKKNHSKESEKNTPKQEHKTLRISRLGILQSKYLKLNQKKVNKEKIYNPNQVGLSLNV